jgi:hypothetical protein
MSSVIAYPGFLFASTVCDLADADVSQLNEGCLAFVESKKKFYRLSQDTVPPIPNGSTVLSVPGGPATPGCRPISRGWTTKTTTPPPRPRRGASRAPSTEPDPLPFGAAASLSEQLSI